MNIVVCWQWCTPQLFPPALTLTTANHKWPREGRVGGEAPLSPAPVGNVHILCGLTAQRAQRRTRLRPLASPQLPKWADGLRQYTGCSHTPKRGAPGRFWTWIWKPLFTWLMLAQRSHHLNLVLLRDVIHVLEPRVALVNPWWWLNCRDRGSGSEEARVSKGHWALVGCEYFSYTPLTLRNLQKRWYLILFFN